MNATTMQLKEEIKKDLKELTRVVIDDGLGSSEIDSLYLYIHHHNQTVESIKQHLDYKIVVSDVIGRNIVTKRFAYKVISIFLKYQKKEELVLVLTCSRLLYYDPYFVGQIYSNQYHQIFSHTN